jgi:CRISPR type III-A-associated protein Csm2
MYKNPKHRKQKFPNKTQNNKKQNSKNPIEEFINELNKKECFSEFDLRDLIGPNGYADNIAASLKKQVKISQLRKFFSEIKEISKIGESKPEEAQKKIWLLYPLIAYAEGRDVIPNNFANMLNKVLEKVEAENCNKADDYKRLEDFMTALIAYFKKYSD